MTSFQDCVRLAAAASLAAALGCGSAPPDAVEEDQPLLGGTPAPNTLRPEVVDISTFDSNCTATMISSTTFVTAAHCIDHQWISKTGTLWTNNGANGGAIAIDKIFSQGTQDPGNSDSNSPNDIAVGHIVTPYTGITPASVATVEPYHGDTLTKVGYGCTTSQSEHCPGVYAREYEQFVYTGNATDMNTHGDSGGPTFQGSIGQNGPIVRITSGFHIDWLGNYTDVDADAVTYYDHIVGLSKALTNDGISYRAQVQSIGWMPAVQNFAIAGNTDQSLRLEALQIWSPRAGVSVCYTGYVQNVGWQAEVCDGDVAGTVGQSKRMEAIKIRLRTMPPGTRGVEYNTYLQGIGWQGWAYDGGVAGTTGQSRPIEAIVISLY